jgi:hypothetical protein
MQLEQVKYLGDPGSGQAVLTCQVRALNIPRLQPTTEFVGERKRRLYGRRAPILLLQPKSLFRLIKIDNNIRHNSPTTAGTGEQDRETARKNNVLIACFNIILPRLTAGSQYVVPGALLKGARVFEPIERASMRPCSRFAVRRADVDRSGQGPVTRKGQPPHRPS